MFLGIGLGLTQQAIGGGVAGLNAQIASAAGIQPAISADLKSGQAWLRGAPYALTSLPGWGFTRAGGGYGETSAGALTWFNGPRTNLCLQSQTFDNASWVKSRATVTADAIAAPDGTLTADKLTEDTNNGTHRVYQTLSKATSAIRYVVSCCFKKAERSFAQIRCFSTGELAGYGVVINLDTGEVSAPYSTGFTGGAAWAESLGDGWFRLILTFITDTEAAFTTYLLPAQSLTASSPAYVGGGSSGVYIWGAQVELAQNPANPQPTDYIPTTSATVTVASQPRLVPGRGQLIEGARTNLCLRSQEFDNASWTKRGTATITADAAVAPDGTTTADLISGLDSGSNDVFQVVTLASAARGEPSLYIKRVSTSGIIRIGNPSDGTKGDWTVDLSLLPDGWSRITRANAAVAVVTEFTGSATNGAGIHIRRTVAGTVSFYVWAAQFEAGTHSSSYIPTTTASVTRPADIPLIDISAYSPAITYPLTMYARFERVVDTGGFENQLTLNDGSSNNRAEIYVGSSDLATGAMTAGGVSQGGAAVAGALAVGTVYRVAARFNTNSIQSAKGGALGTEDTTATLPSSPTQLLPGYGGGSSQSFGYLSEFAIIPGAVSDANLQRLAAA